MRRGLRLDRTGRFDMHHKRLATLFVAALFTVASASAEITFEHVAAYVATAANDDPQLSADGKLIAVQRNRDGNETVDIIKLDGGDVLESFQFKQQIDVGLHRWIDSENLMLRSWRGDPHWGIPSRGRPERFNFKQRKVEKLFSGYEYTEKMQDYSLRSRFGTDQARIVFGVFPKSNDARAIVQHDFSGTTGKAGSGRQRNVVGSSKIMRYDMANEKYEELADIKDMTVVDVYTNAKSEVLAAWGQPKRTRAITFNEQVHLYYRASQKDEWQIAHEGNIDDSELAIIGDGPKKDTVYVLETITGKRAALSYLDLKTGEIKAVFRPARTDVSAYYVDGEHSLYAVKYDDHFPQYHYPNPKHLGAQIHQAARKSFKNANVTITSFARNNSGAIILVDSDAIPGEYYWFDVKSTRMQKLFDRFPQLEGYPLAQRNPIEFPARDDLRIPGYLTIPNKLTSKRPLIVLLRNGPGGAETWGYDWESQLYASLGFVVLEVNHRGSSGFGKSYTKAGFGQWGNMILDDIATGVRWVKKNAGVTSGEVCLVGKGFGGYAALMSIIERPGTFKCAVSIDNVYTDLFANWNRMPRRGQQERDAFTKVGVDPDANVLKDASPRWRARSIRHPILLIEPLQYFSNFAYAQYGNALAFVDELRQGGVDHKLYMVESSRSDNWLKDNDRQKSYFEVAKFLEQNLP